MKPRMTLVPRLDPLEDRICPSLTGIETAPAPTAAEVAPMGANSMENPYEWLRMVMTRQDMMTIANEYDQAPTAADSVSAMKPKNADGAMAGMAQAKFGDGESSMTDSETMPPAQMAMEQPPLVRRSLSPSKMTDMPEAEAAEAEAGEGPADADEITEGIGPQSDTPRPPTLSPGELELRIDPRLRPGRIEPELERAKPSG